VSRGPETVQRAPEAAQGGGAPSQAAIIGFGKYSGKSYEEVCQTDAQYCQWIVQKSQKPDASPDAKAFAAFVQERFPELLTHPSSSPAGRKVFSKPATTRPSPRSSDVKVDSHTVSSGMKSLGGGKYADSTYADVFENDPNYCKFVVEYGLSETNTKAWYWPFIAYVQQRWLLGHLPPEMFKWTGKKGCLQGASYAITGMPSEMTRLTLEALIDFFGGRVLSAVSGKTSYLIVCGKGTNGRAAETGAKYQKAQQLGIPIIRVADLLNEHIQDTSEGGEQDTFESDGHAGGEEHDQ